ncbi:MAG: histidine phosphatase family protein [Aquisalinus sp.]|nr:histidine phosphatase family protein [Aquisalinus sp.]
MPRIFMIRHGHASAGWDADPDPDLDAIGRQQAADVAQKLSKQPAMQIVSSPMLRCLETARPLANMWSKSPIIEPRVSEIIAPTTDLKERTEWLRNLMQGTWTQTSTESQNWRKSVIEALLQCTEDTVVFSHFVAINAALGSASKNDQVLISQPGYCSVNIFSTDGNSLKLIKQGESAETIIR